MTNTNFIEKATEIVNEIHEMNEYCVEEFGDKYAECFPAMATRIIEIDGKRYSLKLEFEVTELF